MLVLNVRYFADRSYHDVSSVSGTLRPPSPPLPPSLEVANTDHLTSGSAPPSPGGSHDLVDTCDEDGGGGDDSECAGEVNTENCVDADQSDDTGSGEFWQGIIGTFQRMLAPAVGTRGDAHDLPDIADTVPAQAHAGTTWGDNTWVFAGVAGEVVGGAPAGNGTHSGRDQCVPRSPPLLPPQPPVCGTAALFKSGYYLWRAPSISALKTTLETAGAPLVVWRLSPFKLFESGRTRMNA